MKTSFTINDAGPAAGGGDESLDGLSVGSTARIAGVTVPEERARLEAMGLCAGRLVEVVKAGDPMIVRVLGTRIGLAAVLARWVKVVRTDGSVAGPFGRS
jgi:Fe2+ transport system protein FeoA